MLLPEYLDTLRCFEYDGEVNGKQVKRVSIFSPKVLKEQNLSVKNIQDLEQHHNLLLFEGYIDKLGNAYAADRRPPIRKNSPVK
jgi:hypothetical protein